MTSQTGKTTIKEGSKGNQTMKFGQLIEYNLRNIFLEKSYTKCGGDNISEKSKPSISLDQ